MAIRKIIKRATDALFTNTEFDGTEATRMVKGTTGERASAEAGDLRFNTTISLMEYYDGTQWKSIDAPPVVSSVSPDNFDTAGDTIVISGSNFSENATVELTNNSGTVFSPATTTRDSLTQITITVSASMVADEDDPYDIKVTNVSGLSNSLANALDFAPEPVFDTASGSIGTIQDITRDSYSLSPVTATSTESDATITYALGDGDSLPSGLSLNSSTGAITGTADAVGTDTTTTFDIVATATDAESNVTTNTREFSITVKAPVIQEFTSTGSSTFSVPTGVTVVDVLVVAGGGAGGNQVGGGGGAGGLIYRPQFPVTPGGSVSYSVGGGGVPNSQTAPQTVSIGQDSTFGTLTAQGGGAGGSYPGGLATQGGSGGGADGDNPNGQGQGTQPQQPGDSGTYGFGNPGGQGNPDLWGGGGGGGAGAGGNNAANDQGGNGGVGKQYDISGSQIYYAGGGGGTSNGDARTPNNAAGGLGGGGNGASNHPQGGSPTNSINPDNRGADPGAANRGGGGGGGRDFGGQNNPGGDVSDGGSGGTGIVIVSY